MPSHTGRRQQEGFLLLGVLFMILLILIALAVAAPKMAEQIRRDKEIETVHRGLQYARGIRMFYTKFGRYPSNMDQLVKSENQKFLRKRYLDPMTGKDDWRIIHLGEAKVGAFGQNGQSNGITPTGASTGTNGASSSPFGGGSSSFGGGSSSSSPFGGGSSSFGGGNSSSPFGGNSGSGFGNTGTSTTTSPSTTGGTDAGSGSGSGNGFGTSSPIGGTTTTGQTSGSAFGSPGVTIGGAIVGVGLLSKKDSIKVYKKQSHYNQWEFVFDPHQSALEASGGAGTNINGAGNGTGVNGTNGSGFGGNNGAGFGGNSGSGFGTNNGSGFGTSGGSGFGGSPTSPTSPTSPVNTSPQ